MHKTNSQNIVINSFLLINFFHSPKKSFRSQQLWLIQTFYSFWFGKFFFKFEFSPHFTKVGFKMTATKKLQTRNKAFFSLCSPESVARKTNTQWEFASSFQRRQVNIVKGFHLLGLWDKKVIKNCLEKAKHTSSWRQNGLFHIWALCYFVMYCAAIQKFSLTFVPPDIYEPPRPNNWP